MKYLIQISVSSVLLVAACSTSNHARLPAQQDDCHQVRAAFDIGSETTKLKVARVDVCLQKITELLFEDSTKVSYKEDLTRSKDKTFSAPLMQSAVTALQHLQAEAAAHGVTDPGMFAGVATSAFRDSKNGQALVDSFWSSLQIKIKIISQEEEGVLGFYSALTKADAGVDDLIVWDIGGGSMQITSRVNGEFVVFKGDLASVSFKNKVIKDIEKSKANTPNPLSQADADGALRIATSHAREHFGNSPLFEKIKAHNGVVYGIGGVHGASVFSQVKKPIYGVSDLNHSLVAQLGKTDAQIGTEYASTDVTNLALVQGYMLGAGIKEVHVLKVNNADGVLVNPKFWPAK